MNYQKVKEVLNKVITITKELSSLDNTALHTLVPNEPSDHHANLIQACLRQNLTAEEYAIYIKYCEFYKSQKKLEFQQSVLSLNDQINALSDTYDERRTTLKQKYDYENEALNLKRAISSLPWIRIKIAYSRLAKEHENYIQRVTKGIIGETTLSDEITALERGNILSRAKNKKRLTSLHERELYVQSKNSKQNRMYKAKVEKLYAEYMHLINELIIEALKDYTILANARKSYAEVTGTETGKIEILTASILEEANKVLIMKDEPIQTYLEEDQIPPYGKLRALSPEEYQSVFTKYCLKYLNTSIARCDTTVSRLMAHMKTILEEQKSCISSLSDNHSGIIFDDIIPSAEEEDIFQLIYKESKNK